MLASSSEEITETGLHGTTQCPKLQWVVNCLFLPCRVEPRAVGDGIGNIHWAKPISLPVLPVMLLMAPLAADPALLAAEPADDVTFERPSWALELAEPATSLALLAVLEATSEVVEALRTAIRPNCGARSTIRDAAKDIVEEKTRRRAREEQSAEVMRDCRQSQIMKLCESESGRDVGRRDARALRQFSSIQPRHFSSASSRRRD